MTEAFEIGVSLALQDGVSEAIGKARRDVASLEQIVLGSGISLRSLREVATRAASVPIAESGTKVEERSVRQVVPQTPEGLEDRGALARPARAADRADGVVSGPVGAPAAQAPRVVAFVDRQPVADFGDAAKGAVVKPKTAGFSASAAGDAVADERFAVLRQSMADISGAAPVGATPVVVQPGAQRFARTIETVGHGSEKDPDSAALWRSAVPPLRSSGDERTNGSTARSVMLESVLRLPSMAPWAQADADGQFQGGGTGDAASDRDATSPHDFAAYGFGLSGPQEAVAAGADGRMQPAAPPAQKRESGPNGGDVFLDGAKVGRWMSRFLNREAERASAGPTSFDPRRGRLLPGVTVGG